MKSLTGQYECAHRSVPGLDYFTARVDRLTLFANGRFALITQDKSRLMHAAKSLASGQQTNMDAPETRREGSYSSQGMQLSLSFDAGEHARGEIQDEGLQIDQDYFEKVSDSTFLPPPQRLKSNMEDIAKGLKIAGAIGGTVLKAARTIQDSLQTQPPPQEQSAPAQSEPMSSSSQNQPSAPKPPPTVPSTPASSPPDDATLFCDQCGTPVRPGKKFCNRCGARLP